VTPRTPQAVPSKSRLRGRHPEEPYAGKLRVRVCGGSGRVTARFYPERLTGEWPEVFILAVGIGALDTGDTLGVVAAENELLYHLCDALDAETTVDDGVFVFVLIGDALKIFLEQDLDGVDYSRLINRFPRRGDLKG